MKTFADIHKALQAHFESLNDPAEKVHFISLVSTTHYPILLEAIADKKLRLSDFNRLTKETFLEVIQKYLKKRKFNPGDLHQDHIRKNMINFLCDLTEDYPAEWIKTDVAEAAQTLIEGHCCGFSFLWGYAKQISKQTRLNREPTKKYDDSDWFNMMMLSLSYYQYNQDLFNVEEEKEIDRFMQLVMFYHKRLNDFDFKPHFSDTANNNVFNQFSTALPLTPSLLKITLERLLHEDQITLLVTQDRDFGIHVTAIYTEGGQYTFFNCYEKDGEQKFHDLMDLSQAIFKSVNYDLDERTPAPFGLCMLDFSNTYSYPTQEALLNLVLENISDKKAWVNATHKQYNNINAFCMSAIFGDPDLLKAYVHLGADLHFVHTLHQHSLLHIIAINGHTEYGKTLIDLGIDISFKDKYEETPLIYAAELGNEQLIEYAIQKKHPDLNESQDNVGNRLIHIAVLRHHHSTLALLLKNGANPNIANNAGATPVSLAVGSGDLTSLSLLKDFNAHFKILDENCNLMNIARANNYPAIIDFLYTIFYPAYEKLLRDTLEITLFIELIVGDLPLLTLTLRNLNKLTLKEVLNLFLDIFQQGFDSIITDNSSSAPRTQVQASDFSFVDEANEEIESSDWEEDKRFADRIQLYPGRTHYSLFAITNTSHIIGLKNHNNDLKRQKIT